jgi:hypothetical protein
VDYFRRNILYFGDNTFETILNSVQRYRCFCFEISKLIEFHLNYWPKIPRDVTNNIHVQTVKSAFCELNIAILCVRSRVSWVAAFVQGEILDRSIEITFACAGGHFHEVSGPTLHPGDLRIVDM